MSLESNALPHACKRLQAARHIVVFTGAGVSAESGIPTFRDESGFGRLRLLPSSRADYERTLSRLHRQG